MEGVRRFFRDRMGYKSTVYVFASKLANLFFALLKGGWPGVKILSGRITSDEWVSLRSPNHPIFIRSVQEDFSSIVNNIFREEYGQLPRLFSPKLIIDAGAYIGDTSSYFLSKYPSASVVAIEPNPESHEIAYKNLVCYGDRVTLVNAALSPEGGKKVRISGCATGARISDKGVSVDTISVEDLLISSKADSIDILKMDIEGYEVPVLMENSDNWLSSVKWLLLETHGAHIEQRLIPVLKQRGFRVTRHRNVWYCQNMSAG